MGDPVAEMVVARPRPPLRALVASYAGYYIVHPSRWLAEELPGQFPSVHGSEAGEGASLPA